MTEKENELTDVLENLARHYIHTSQIDKKTVGCFEAESDALELLETHKRFRIIRKYGKTRTGYWPENEPKDEPKEQPKGEQNAPS